MVGRGWTIQRRLGILVVGAVTISGCAGASPSPSSLASATSSSSLVSDSAAPSIPPPTPVETAPTRSPPTSSGASFNLLPTGTPVDLNLKLTCTGSIAASDPVALVQLHAAAGSSVEYLLRDYADVGHPRTVCNFGGATGQLIDARHVLISTSGIGGAAYALVDLPEVRYHWFKLPVTPWTELLAVSPRLDQVAWLARDPAVSGTDLVHITTTAGDHVVAILPDANTGRCGSGDDSKTGAYTRSGEHLLVLDQPLGIDNSLSVLEDETAVLSMLPPAGGWPSGTQPAMALWSPVSETLYYRQGGDVWRWSAGSNPVRFLPGVTWYYPTISPDGSHLAYQVFGSSGPQVYLVDLAHAGSPKLIGKGPRKLPVFVNSTQLWFRSPVNDHGCAGAEEEKSLIYNVVDGSESPSIIDEVLAVWPATSSNW